MARMSNRDRIARAAEEAKAAAADKLAKKEKKTPAKRPSRARAKEVRMKVVWEIHNAHGRPVKTFAYPDKAAAEAEAKELTKSTGHPHELRATKVPMD